MEILVMAGFKIELKDLWDPDRSEIERFGSFEEKGTQLRFHII